MVLAFEYYPLLICCPFHLECGTQIKENRGKKEIFMHRDINIVVEIPSI